MISTSSLRVLTSVLGLLVSFSTTSAQADGGSVRVDTKYVPEGMLAAVDVNGLPVFVLHRRQIEIDNLRSMYDESDAAAVDCARCDPVLRSVSADYLVVWGYSPDSGCELTYVSSTATNEWEGYSIQGLGGFVDKCSGAEYDLSGRKLSGRNEGPNRLTIPRHTITNGVIVIY